MGIVADAYCGPLEKENDRLRQILKDIDKELSEAPWFRPQTKELLRVHAMVIDGLKPADKEGGCDGINP